MSSTKEPQARPHFTQDITPGRAKGIEYMFAGETRRLKKTVAAPESGEAPATLEQGRRRMRIAVEGAPKDNQQAEWPIRGLKRVETAPQDNKEQVLFERRSLARVAVVPADQKEQLFPKGGKAMIQGRSFTSSGNILTWGVAAKLDAEVFTNKI